MYIFYKFINNILKNNKNIKKKKKTTRRTKNTRYTKIKTKQICIYMSHQFYITKVTKLKRSTKKASQPPSLYLLLLLILGNVCTIALDLQFVLFSAFSERLLFWVFDSVSECLLERIKASYCIV